MTDSPLVRGYLVAFTATALFSATAILISHLTTRFAMPPVVLAFWRDILVACSLAAALFLLDREQLHLHSRDIPFFVFYGLFLAVFSLAWTLSVALNGAAVATVLIYISPAFTALIGWRWGSESLGRLKILAIALSIVGCIFASGAHDPAVWRVNARGIAVGLGTGLAFTLYSLMGKASSGRGVNPWTATLYTFAFGSAFLLLAQRPDTLFWLSRPAATAGGGWSRAAEGWGTILLLAIGPTLGGFGLYTVSLTHLPATTANLILTLEPGMTAALAYLLLGERLTVPQLAGSAVVLVSVFILRLSDRRAPAIDLSVA